MSRNAVFFAWNRPIPGREQVSGAHFQEFFGYLEGLAGSGAIQGFDVVLLDSHGGDLNGFFLIRGEPADLDALQATQEWMEHMTRAVLHLEGSGVVRGTTGDAIPGRMELWTKLIPG